MNFSVTRISSVFAASNVYWTCALEACDFFSSSCVLSTSKGLVNDLIIGTYVTAKDGCTMAPKPSIE